MSRQLLKTSLRAVTGQMNSTCKNISLTKQKGELPGGFPYSAYNAEANVSIEGIQSMTENVLIMPFNSATPMEDSFLDFDVLYREHDVVSVISSTVSVNEKLYDTNIIKGPLLFDVELDSFGKASTQLKAMFFLENDPVPLITNVLSFVRANSTTRKVFDLPRWWLDKYTRLLAEDGKVNKGVEKLDFSGGDSSLSTQSRSKISLFDTGRYGYTLWSRYPGFCQEAYGKRLLSSQDGSRRSGDLFRQRVKEFSMLFKKASRYDDSLTVHVSPQTVSVSESKNTTMSNNDDYNVVYYFDVRNESKMSICLCKIEYFP